jgi:hypothetical protein
MTPLIPKTGRPSPARFRAGVFCIVLNYILGWPFLVSIESAAAIQDSRVLAMTGPVVYAFSWVLLGVGFWLAGPEAVTFVKRGFRRLWSRRGVNEE